jgi:methionyl-tRNA formyltransferase
LKYKRKRILFLHNESSFEEYKYLIKKYFPKFRFKVEFSTDSGKLLGNYDLIILWNYPKKISIRELCQKIIVFHASDLPEGRGWAPIANMFINENKSYTLSGIRIDSGVDTGDILIKFKFPLLPSYTANFIRKIDNELMCFGARIIADWNSQELIGIKQESTNVVVSKKRNPEMNQLDISHPISDYIPLLKSAEREHLCFIEHDGSLFDLVLIPRDHPKFPQVEVIEFANGFKRYYWNSWKQENAGAF